MANFDLSQYETVEERIGRLYDKHPDARITTALVSPVEQIESTATFVAYVYLDNGSVPKATGFAMEKAGQGYVNKTSHVENCETSAIGRALANMGLHGNKRPSREEMQKAQGGDEQPKPQRTEPIQKSGKQLGEEIKVELDELKKVADESVAEGYSAEARQAYNARNRDELQSILKRITDHKAKLNQENYADKKPAADAETEPGADLPEDLY